MILNYAAVTVWKDVMKDLRSKESADSVKGNFTKRIPDIWIYSRYWIHYPIFGYVLDIWIHYPILRYILDV